MLRPGTALMWAGATLMVVSYLLRDALPEPSALRDELRNEPLQTQTQAAPFQTVVGGVTYTITPQADYEIWGLVVSRHDSSVWWDWIHQAANDHLNVVDLCVVFGENVTRGAYVGLDYSSGQWVCYVQTRSAESWQRFSMRALSNNHLLADRSALVTQLRDIRVGDQIRVRGMLSEYAHHHGMAFTRGTSLTREDTGNGACETIYVQDVQILRAGGGPWRILLWVGVLICALGAVVWFRAPIKVS